MTTLMWILQGVLALVFLGAGSIKLIKSREELQPMMPYVEDFSDGTMKLIGLLELLGAIGVIVPTATGIMPSLTTFAAGGLALTMVGAAITHIRRGEMKEVPKNVVFFLLAVYVAYHHAGLNF